MDDIFPGFLQWQKEREAKRAEICTTFGITEPKVHPLEQGLYEAWKQAVHPLDADTIDRWNDIATHLTLPESWKLPPEMRGKPEA